MYVCSLNHNSFLIQMLKSVLWAFFACFCVICVRILQQFKINEDTLHYAQLEAERRHLHRQRRPLKCG